MGTVLLLAPDKSYICQVLEIDKGRIAGRWAYSVHEVARDGYLFRPINPLVLHK